MSLRGLIARLARRAPGEVGSDFPANSGPGGQRRSADLARTCAMLLERGDLVAALQAAASGLEQSPEDLSLQIHRAEILVRWGRYKEGVAEYARAIGQSPNAATYTAAGWSAYLCGDAGTAVALHTQAIERAVTPDALFGLAIAKQAIGEFEPAIRYLQSALDIDASLKDAWLNIAICQRATGDNVGSERSLRRALAANPEDSYAWLLMALALGSQSRTEESFEAFSRSRQIDQASGAPVGCIAELALSLIIQGRFADAIHYCESDLPAHPDPHAHYLYAWALLTVGRHRPGWSQYEFRWLKAPLKGDRPPFGRPRWNGQALAGKTVLLWSEQGFGDTFQFARFARVFKARGAAVVLKVGPGLSDLATKFHGVDRVVTNSAELSDFDFHIPLLSIPAALGMSERDIPSNVPYIDVDPALQTAWESRVGGGSDLKVGLVWAGNQQRGRDSERSIGLEHFLPLWSVPGIRLISLQKDLRPGDGEILPVSATFFDAGPLLKTFSDTAALIGLLDLVISVDTSVAHLAGALGKPVWLLSSMIPDFRWMEHRLTSPWYPTMRIFREDPAGRWRGLLQAVAGELSVARYDRRHLLPSVDPSSNLDTQGLTGASATGDLLQEASPRISQVVEARDGIFQVLADDDDESRSVAYYGEYLSLHLRLLSRVLPVDARVLEYFSGIGSHTLWIGQHLSADGELVCYEPRPFIRRLLGHNLGANGGIKVTFPRGSLTGPDGRPAWHGNPDPSHSPLHTIDDLQLQRLDLIKVNDPAASLSLLAGADRTMWTRRPLLFLRTSGEEDEVAIRDLAAAHAYRCWKVVAPLHDLGNFNRRDTDIFSGGVAHAMLGIPEESATPIPGDLPEI